MTGTDQSDSASANWIVPNDPFGAFCRANHIALAPTADGQLSGLTFAVKDVFDVAGSVTGFGQPTWLQTHAAATQHAAVVQQLLACGARLVGRTVSDELTYSLTGENVHYGTPTNPASPDCVPGGSSSGSASAVAAGLVDFSLGTDCAGSVRLPASYCGIYGMRPTHGMVSTHGVVPFAPSLDTVGWFARSPQILQQVGSMLLAQEQRPVPSSRLLIASDCFDMLTTPVREALDTAVDQLSSHFATVRPVTLAPDGLESWMACFRVVQGGEIWRSLGDWIVRHQPVLGPGIDERIADASAIEAVQFERAQGQRRQIVEHLRSLIQPGDVLCLPTSPRVAPARNTAVSTVEVTYRYQAICLLSIASLAGLPQVSLPVAQVDGLPLGLSVAAMPGADSELLRIAALAAIQT